ncbi:MAG: myo-inositol-1-phosphate synthase [Pirellulaceae bacterium]|nr:MAG: myo-inositol-1-phosphate synthase [Pirellulaceae bacterium]
MSDTRIGIWLIGARGGVATTTILGLLGLAKQKIPAIGLVSELALFNDLALASWDRFVVGGHEIRRSSLYDEAKKLFQSSHVLDPELIENCRDDLAKIDECIRPGILFNSGSTIEQLAQEGQAHCPPAPRAAVEQLVEDLAAFRRDHQLHHVVVVNVASTEPPVDERTIPGTWDELSRQLDQAGQCPLRASSLYAIAAFEAGCSYVNFTPSLGSAAEALCQLALRRGQCHAGRDGKTGETLLKSVLAPMFAHRNLEVMSWVGHNIFGNMDGLVLDNPENKQSKVVSKDRLLREILGYAPQTLVSIEYIQSLGDWKTAWDHIHFRGFLGTPMVLQFIWQGCDSILAAPLVLDLVRFTERAARRGETGVLTWLASFFKSPMGVAEFDFHRQFQMLEAWATAVRQETPSACR